MNRILNKELRGVALPYVHYGTHLNNSNKTIYGEMQNFSTSMKL